jgi:hypothetical protein
MANIAARRLSRTVAARHPDVTLREVDVDAVAAGLYSRPESFDVILTSNVYGDILSKLANALAGSVGLASVRNVIAATLIAPAAGLPDRQLTTPPPGAKASHFELRPVLGIYALIGFGTLTLWLLTIQLAFHLAGIGLASPVFAGVALGTPCLTGILIGTLFERVRQILRFSVDCGAGVALMGIGYAIISLVTNIPLVVAGLLLAGVGFGLNQPNCSAWLLSLVATEFRGRAAAGLTFAVCAGQLASPFVYQPLVATAGSAASFAIIAGICLVVVTAMLYGRQSSPLPDQQKRESQLLRT